MAPRERGRVDRILHMSERCPLLDHVLDLLTRLVERKSSGNHHGHAHFWSRDCSQCTAPVPVEENDEYHAPCACSSLTPQFGQIGLLAGAGACATAGVALTAVWAYRLVTGARRSTR